MSRADTGAVCIDCGRRWAARSEAHCAVCHRHFTSPTAFDLHLSTSRDGETVTHRDPATLLDRHGRPRLVLIARASGPAWACAGERRAHWRSVS
jgi:hypothetical protein